MAYVCKTLAERADIYGQSACKEWVTYVEPEQTVSILHQLAITKADMVLIGGSISTVFAIFAAFAIVAKAVNSL